MPPLIGTLKSGGSSGGGSTPLVVNFAKDFIASQDRTGVLSVSNGSALSFDVTEGLGVALAISTDPVYVVPTAVGQVQTVVMNFKVADTPNINLGIILGLTSFSAPPAGNYYFCRCVGQNIRISKVLDGASSTLQADTAFTMVNDDIVTLTASVDADNVITFDAENLTNPDTASRSVTDSTDPLQPVEGQWWAGFRLGFSDSAGWIRDFNIVAS